MKKILFCIFVILFSSTLQAERVRTLRCSEDKAVGIVKLINYIDLNWEEVEELWKNEGALAKPKCLKRRFERNGVVMCHDRQRVAPERYRCDGKNGWAGPGGIRANICSGFTEVVDNMEFHNKRACYTALLFKLFGDNCYKRSRFPGRYMDLRDFGFKWYKERNPVTIDFRECNFKLKSLF